MSGLLPVADALARLLAGAGPLPAEQVALAGAMGRVLAAPIAARLTQPPFAAAAMDGYAMRWADMPGPWDVVGESAAGKGWPGTLAAGQAVRIFTGAPLPKGADTIVVQEEVSRTGDQAMLAGEGPPGQGAHIRSLGNDFAAGAPLLAAGTRLGAAMLGLVAAAGHGTLPLVRRPRVALLATGNELVLPGETPGPDQIVSSNPVMLAALLTAAGAEVLDAGLVPDTEGQLADALGAQIDTADIIVTIGGASVGDHDLVVPVLRALGADIDFWRIAMRPGKPLLAGQLGGTRVVGLPGNPVSAFVCARLFLVPLVARLAGRADAGHQPIHLQLRADLPANGARQDYLRGRRDGNGVWPQARQDSALLSVLAGSDVLIVRPPFAPACQNGSIVDCLALDMFQTVF